MTRTIAILLCGLGLLLVGVGLLGTLLGVRATLASFNNLETGFIMAAYYVGYVAGTVVTPPLVRSVGHIRAFAAFAAVAAASSLAFGLLVTPWAWFALRMINGLCIVSLYMVVESWLNEQSAGPARGRIFSIYMTSTLVALGGGQFLLLAGEPSELALFAIAAIMISIGVVPVAITRVTEPRIHAAVPVHLIHLFRISPLGLVGSFGAGLVNGAFWGMAPVFGQRLAMDQLQIALLMSATILGGALLQLPIGHLSDRFDRRTVLVLISLATAITAAAGMYIVAGGQAGLILIAGLYGGLMFSLYGISVAHTNDHLETSQVLEATRGLLLIYGLGALCGPLLGGFAMEALGPLGLPLVSTLSMTALALFGLFRMTRRAAPPLAEQSDYVPMVRTTPVALEMHPDADVEPEHNLDSDADGKA